MAQIVLGGGTAHSPLLVLPPQEWSERALGDFDNPRLNLSDGRWVSYSQLLAEVGPVYADRISPEDFEHKAAACQAALDRLAAELAAVAPDVVIVVGDDQEELFAAGSQPAIAVFYGAELATRDKYAGEHNPAWVRNVASGYLMERVHTHPAAPELAVDIIQGLIERDVDVAAVEKVVEPRVAGFGHAFSFIVKRLLGERRVPLLPVLLNTYFPPNVLSAERCYNIGLALRETIAASLNEARVAIIASGGLSHFVVDEELDRRVIAGLAPGNAAALRTLTRGALNAGSSEILNWVLTAGAMHGSPLKWSEYQPLYRTPAGTGIGVAFALWDPG